MGDDPYDFDIGIPNAARGGYGTSHGYHYESDDDMNSSSGVSGSEEDEEESPVKSKPQARSNRVAASSKQGPAGSSNALDKAKSFLSKYSSKATPTAAKSRKVKMSLDDDDFSLDSSGEEVKKPKKVTGNDRVQVTKASDSVKHSGPAMTSHRRSPSGSEASDHSDEERSPVRPFKMAISSDDSDGERSKHTKKAPPADNKDTNKLSQNVNGHADRDEEYSRPTLVTTAVKLPMTRSLYTSKKEQEVNADDEVESIASESEYESSSASATTITQNTTTASKPSVASTPQVSSARRVSDVSESGAYEEEHFEDESTGGPSLTTAQAQAVVGSVSRPRDDECNFDYSLDFAEDPVEQAPLQPQDKDEAQRRQSRTSSSSSRSTGDGSYVEESDTDGEGFERGNIESTPNEPQTSIDAKPQPVEPLTVPHITPTSLCASTSSPLLSAAPPPPPSGPVPATKAPLSTMEPTVFAPEAAPQPQKITLPSTRPRVVIVREYERDRQTVEKRDAETQCTGNHAGIQTDLVPPGMHAAMPATDAHDAPVESLPVPPLPSLTTEQRRVASDPPVARPPPSPYSTYGLYDPLQLPTDISMSSYKQQLLLLQQQIHQKKLETERLFRDRVSSRYTSLRGTERFLESYRPARVPLWEALRRVDPSLDEAKAKEIARLMSHEAA